MLNRFWLLLVLAIQFLSQRQRLEGQESYYDSARLGHQDDDGLIELGLRTAMHVQIDMHEREI